MNAEPGNPVSQASSRPPVSAGRKDDHVRLAADQQRDPIGSGGDHSEFDDVGFVHHALAGIDREEVSLAADIGPLLHWPVPLYINAMTGGTERTGAINRDLAIAARETGVPVATGSLSPYFADETVAETFSVMRRENPAGFIMANVNATTSVRNARRAVDLLEANALQIHINAVQETVMPEGDRSFGSWAPRIQEIVDGLDVPVIVKEVGFGLSRETVTGLADLGVYAADVGGRGGTNFAVIENSRRSGADYSYLADWGQSTPACLLDNFGGPTVPLPVLASGGVRHALDVARALALGGAAVGASGNFLHTVLEGGVSALVGQITSWLDKLAAIMTMLGARRPADLSCCDVLVRGGLREFCADRGIDTRSLANRSRAAR